MRRSALGLVLLGAFGSSACATGPRGGEGAPAPRPRLLLLLVVDQLRADTLARVAPTLPGGLGRLWREGARFGRCLHDQASTATGPGHATLLTGATPRRTGIVSNYWYDRERRELVYAASDPAHRWLSGDGGALAGTSPRSLRTPTLGDELLARDPAARVVAMSLKDRAAILLGGWRPTGAYWLDAARCELTTSTYYAAALPSWVRAVNARGACARAAPTPGARRVLKHRAAADGLLAELAIAALDGERLGRDDATDLLAVSFSAYDYAAHAHSFVSPEAAEVLRGVDAAVGALLSAVERAVGPGRTAVAFTADHGGMAGPEAMAGRGLPSGRIEPGALIAAIDRALDADFGPRDWVVSFQVPWIYLAPAALEGAPRSAVLARARAVAASWPGIAAAYTLDEIVAGALPDEGLARLYRRATDPARAGEVAVRPAPYWFLPEGPDDVAWTGHGAPYAYDMEVPLVLWGAGVRAPARLGDCAAVDVAPTLAALADVAAPPLSEGRVLREALAR